MALDIKKLWAEKPKFRVGDRVQFHIGPRMVIADVVEYRGPLGVGGRQIFGIRFPFTEDETRYTEMPAEELELATEETDKSPAARSA